MTIFCKKCGKQLNERLLCVECSAVCSFCGGVKSIKANMCFNCTQKSRKLASKKWVEEDVIEMYLGGHSATEIAKCMGVSGETIGTFIRRIRDKCDYVMGVYVNKPKIKLPHQKKSRQKEDAEKLFEKALETHRQYKQDIENEIIDMKEQLEFLEEELFECDVFLGLLDTPEKINKEEKIATNRMGLLKKIFGEHKDEVVLQSWNTSMEKSS